ncbi:MAG TPA: efflux RND transporter periplasmic adaptor subunit [Terriglobales bacterium]|jgi:HlyD family secretion protein|nr:efflux RND transporter periplasmic adaptor subunit [Terriglobales bacterium]
MPLNENSSGSQPRRWWVAALAILAAVIVLAAFVSRRDDSIAVRTAVVAEGSIRSLVSTNGKIEPLNNFEAHAPVATSVQRVLVKEGDAVKKGQLLVILDDAEARAQAARAQTLLKAAQADLSATERGGSQEEVLSLDAQLVKARADRDVAQHNVDALKKLAAEGAATAGEVREAESTLATAEAQLTFLKQKQTKRYSNADLAHVEAQRVEADATYEAAQDVLSKSNVRAPFDGIVYSLPAKQGGFVAAGDLLLQVADLRKVLVRAFVDEPDVGRLTAGDAIEVTWDAVPGRVWHASVTAIPSTVKLHGTRNVGETTSIIDNKDLKLLPNINVGVTIVVAQHDHVLVVPREAVRMDDTRPYVLEVSGHELKRRDVETSLSSLTQVEIKSGLSANDVVAISSINGKPIGDRTQVKF